MTRIKRGFMPLILVFAFVFICGNEALAERNGRSRRSDETVERRDKVRRRQQEPDMKRERRQERVESRRGHDRNAEQNRDRRYDRNENRHRNGNVDRRGNDGGRQHDYRYETRSRHGHWSHNRRIYQRPFPGHMRHPRYGHRYGGYTCHRYPRHYPRPTVIIFSRVPVIVFGHPTYRQSRYVSRTVINLSGHRAQILINGHPYVLNNGRDILYPGEAVGISVPSGELYDLDASVLVGGEWFESELEEGDPSELIIPPVD